LCSVGPMTGDSQPPLGDTLQRAIGATAIAGLRRDAGYLDPLIAEGLIDARFAAADPASSPDAVGLIRDLGSALGAAIARSPALVRTLGIDALELLRRDSVGPSAQMARAIRSERTVAAAEVDAAADLPSVAGIVEGRGGVLVRQFGGVHLLAFEASADAIRALLDLKDAIRDRAPLRVGADVGEASIDGTDLYGPVVAAACRVASVAGWGEVLITHQIRDRLGEMPGVAFGFTPPREVEEGGPIAAWSVART